MTEDLQPIVDFLGCPTPAAWLDAAVAQPEVLLIDHANCEKKAAGTAMNLIYRYIDRTDLLNKLSRLAREELRHFEQVLAIMVERGIAYRHVSPSRYAAGLREHVRSHEPARLIDTLIVGAFIEARSCERFAALAPLLDAELADFYRSLLKSEARHYRDYLRLAERYAGGAIDDRIEAIRTVECALVMEPDTQFRFHSGIPTASRT